VDVFILNLVLSCLHARRNCQAPLSETALDMLAVGGLVGFPPTETGPLNYGVRLGSSKLLEMCTIYTKKFPFLAEMHGTTITPQALLAEDKFKEIYSSADTAGQSSSDGDLAEGLAVMRARVMLMDRDKLQQMLASSGVTNSEVFMLPSCVAFTITILLVLLLLMLALLTS